MKPKTKFYIALLCFFMLLYAAYDTGTKVRQAQIDCMLQGGDIAKAQLIDSLQERIDSLENK